MKRILSAALTAATILSMAGVSALPLANAQSTSDLQAQIAALLAQIQQLQGQLNGGASASASYTFTRDLTVGSTGADVTALQKLLIAKGFLTLSVPTTYFGGLTKAALAKFQAANGISPAAGYFGPKTRAFVNAMNVVTPPIIISTSTPPVTPSTGLTVGLASDNPGVGSLVSGASRIPVMAVNFTAGNSGPATVSEIKFHKTGVLSDSAISGAYLVMNGKVFAQYNSINQGVIDFSGLNWQIPAGTTQEVMLAIDTTGTNNGNTTGFSIMSASDITSWDGNNNAIAETGTFPMNGNTFTLTSVSNPNLASLTIASSAIGTQVTAGTQGNLVGAWIFTGANSKLWLKGINFRVIGSANKGDLRNVKLMVNGTQVGSTLATVGSDGSAYFNTSANPAVLNTGGNNVQVFADVMGSPNFNFQFEVLNSYDVLAVDSQYNVPVIVTNNGGVGTLVSIQPGQTTITQDANTPTGNIAKGQSQVTLAKFDLYASGEAVRVKWVGFKLTFAGYSNNVIDDAIRNISLVDDAGGQIGSTINTPSTANTCTDSAYSNSSSSAWTYTNCFGSSGSPINYVVPANTTRVLSLKADVQPLAAFTSVTAALTGNSNNFQGLTSSAMGGTGSAQGSALTLSNSSLSVSKNNAVGNQNVSAGVTNQRIGSYSFTASSAEGVNVSNVSVIASGPLQNLKVLVNGTQFGTTQSTVSSGTTYTFSGAQFTITAGNTVNVDVYADTLSSATGSVSPATVLTGLSGSGQISFTAISLTGGSVTGQNLSFAGSATITVGADSTQPPSGQVVMGSTGNTLGVFRFTETSNVENVKVTDLTVHATTTGNAAFSNVKLYNGSTLLGTAGSASTTYTAPATTTQSGFDYTFHLGSALIVPQANSISLTLKGDAATYASNGATDNATSTFGFAATSTITALGATSNKPTTVSTVSGAVSNTQTILRSVLTASAAALGGSNHSKTTTDDLGTVTFTANSAGPVGLASTTVTLSGSGAVSSTPSLQLIDQNGLDVVVAGEAVSSTNASSKVWNFNTAFQISAGGSYTFKVRINSNTLPPGQNGISQNVSAAIQANTDVRYYDGLDASSTATGLISLPTVAVPITINSVTYPQGQ